VRKILFLYGAALTPLAAGAAWGQTHDRHWAACVDPAAKDNVLLEACTAVVRSGRETDANLAVAFMYLCLAHNNKGDHHLALQKCDEAIRLKPGHLEAYLFRGHAHFNNGDNDRAIADYSEAITLGSKAATTYVKRGAAYHKKGDNAHALADLNQAISIDQNDPTAFFLRGAVFQAEEKSSEAVADYTRAIEIAPRFAAALYRRGALKREMGDVTTGDADMAAARRMDPLLGK